MEASGLNSVADIPQPWRAALAQIKSYIPSAVIAGGCLRDREFGKKVKDIDIFVPVSTSTEADLKAVKEMLIELGWQEVHIDTAKTYPDGCDTRVIGVVEAKLQGCPPIQVVVGEWNTENIFDHFDFGICQISFDGRTIKRSVDYQVDRRWKQFRLATVRSDAAFVASINRWARLKEKYEGWTFNLGTRANVVEIYQLTGRSARRGPNIQTMHSFGSLTPIDVLLSV
jgi:hypothetical protein